jgi:hypothetical protein
VNDLLTLCARAQPNPVQFPELIQQASIITDWSRVPAQAELQGLGPLLYEHLKAAGVSMPMEVKRELQGLYLRHRHANQVRDTVLAEILVAFGAAGIRTLVLKGAALAHLVYPEPGLRSMRDLDLLVSPAEVRRAQRHLVELGFAASVPDPTKPLPNKHLPIAARTETGLQVSVELHHNLFNAFEPVSMTLEELTGPPLAFALNDVTAYTLGYEDMLWHLCQHVAYHANIWEPIRLIWVADLVSFAETFVAEIDWERVARDHRPVLKVLSLFHFVTPLSDTLRQRAAIRIGHRPQGLGQEFEGWPRRRSRAELRRRGYRRVLKETCCPSEWWLRLHYGLDSAQPLFWYRWFRHPLYVLGPFYLAEKLRLWWHLRFRPQLRSKE